ncbi:unnamed protein product [Schistosoma curassoni]|uniref:Solute carrier family 40 protein n=1 Tax=Schistosoma curassoni TaxID=6186 RepID=A0A183KER5_9TREM|nr:unnamed protein product [Schistosoma curassoni]
MYVYALALNPADGRGFGRQIIDQNYVGDISSTKVFPSGFLLFLVNWNNKRFWQSNEILSSSQTLVSATFAASLVSSPAIGAYLGRVYSEELIVALATAIAFLDICFILACVPESLSEKVRIGHLCSVTTLGGPVGKFSWGKADPFATLRQMTNDHLVLMICITTFLSYLPEAGQYSCFFVYLRLVMGFTEENVALFIAVVGIMSCIAQSFDMIANLHRLKCLRYVLHMLNYHLRRLRV